MKDRTETALSKFSEGYNCAQSVFYSLCDDLGFDKNAALKMARGLRIGIIGCRFGFEFSYAASDVPPSMTPLNC